MAAITTEIKGDGTRRPSPKPRKSFSGQDEPKVASPTATASFGDNRPVPKPRPRKKSSASSTHSIVDLENPLRECTTDEPLAEYVNCDREKMNEIRKSMCQDSSQPATLKHVLDVENKTIGSSSSDESDDFEEIPDYINGGMNDYLNNPDFMGDVRKAGRLNRVQSLSGEDECFRLPDSYVKMESPLKLKPSTTAEAEVKTETDNTYIRMNPLRGSSIAEEDGEHIYNVPKSKLVIEPINPVPLGGIYEMDSKQNPLHPRHLSSSSAEKKTSSPKLSRQGTSDPTINFSSKSQQAGSPGNVISHTPRSPPPNMPLPQPPASAGSPMFNSRSRDRAELAASWSPGSETSKYLSPKGDRSATAYGSTFKKLFQSKPDSPASRKKGGSPRIPHIKTGFHGRLNREVAEQRLCAAGVGVGDYLLRESSKVTKEKAQIVISLNTTDIPMHVIIDYRDNQFWLSASQTNQISFHSIDELLAHYTKHPIVVDGKGSKVNLSKPLALKRKPGSPSQ